MCRELREELATVQGREMEASHRKSDLEKQLELAEAETLTGLFCTAQQSTEHHCLPFQCGAS